MPPLPFSTLTIDALRACYASGTVRPSDVIEEILARIAADADNPVWISRVSDDALRERARRLDAMKAADGAERMALFGMPFAVKDNIDVAGLPTTAACPDFAYLPARSAATVERLEAAGAIVIGKTNLDQFATGLVGVRSPYGVPRNPIDGAYIPGGSSSGSAVAVAAGMAAFALGTDTAGSGRIPAGFNNVVGVKPTIGLASAAGVVPACQSLDCVSVLALSVADGMRVLAAMAGPDERDPFSRTPPEGYAIDRVLTPAGFDFAVPAAKDLRFFGDAPYERLFGEAVARLESIGGRRRDIAFEPFAATGAILYSDAGVAERVAAVGDFLRDHPRSVLPVTREIIERGRNAAAADVYRARVRMAGLRSRAMAALDGTALLLVPTAPTIYRVADIERDPIALNANLGTYTNFVNLMDLAAIAVPSGFTAAGLPFGVTLIGRAFSEPLLAAIATAFCEASGIPTGAGMPGQPVASAVPSERPAT
ncbi:MAG TPA: allophanate hydrolase [Stellaceae bacterium]|nr:allophanate hydrolase [Stellaceae bacterium]